MNFTFRLRTKNTNEIYYNIWSFFFNDPWKCCSFLTFRGILCQGLVTLLLPCSSPRIFLSNKPPVLHISTVPNKKVYSNTKAKTGSSKVNQYFILLNWGTINQFQIWKTLSHPYFISNLHGARLLGQNRAKPFSDSFILLKDEISDDDPMRKTIWHQFNLFPTWKKRSQGCSSEFLLLLARFLINNMWSWIWV